MLVPLNKCVVVCDPDLQRGQNYIFSLYFYIVVMCVCVSSSILFKYESSRGHLFVLSWARVQRVAMGSVVSE